jgi:hypothetical protein
VPYMRIWKAAFALTLAFSAPASGGGCTGQELHECVEVPSCSPSAPLDDVPPGATSCELDYALCLQRHGCSADMYSNVLHASARSTFFVLHPAAATVGSASCTDGSDQTFADAYGGAEAAQAVFVPNSASTAEALAHVLSTAVGPMSEADVGAVLRWASAASRLAQRSALASAAADVSSASSVMAEASGTLIVMSDVPAVAVWAPGVHFSLQRAVTSAAKWPGGRVRGGDVGEDLRGRDLHL